MGPENNKPRDIELSTNAERNIIRGIEGLPRSEQKKLNIKRAVEKQKLAAQWKANNTSQMVEDFQNSQRVKNIRMYQNQQDKENAELQ